MLWKKAGWSAAKTGLSYAVPGAAFKIAGKGIKAAKVASKLRWTNVTQKGSRVKNISVNKTVKGFGKALKKSGYSSKTTYSKGRKIVNYTKNNKRYSYRGKANSGKHTYDYYSGRTNFKGKPKVVKIRVRR